MTHPDSPRRAPRGDRVSRSEADPLPLAESLAALSARIGAGDVGAMAVVFGRWDVIVGPVLAAHVRPIRLDRSVLVVGVDHPAWVTQVRHLTPDILERLREVCGKGEAPERLEVRVER